MQASLKTEYESLMNNLPLDIQRMRRAATLLLCAMVVLFFVSLLFVKEYPWLDMVRAFSEAAMVGALADWFAVTALFRQPLGLPIPHTAIVPNNKGRIGKSLGLFIEQHFISDDLLTEHHIDLGGPLARWLSLPENRAFLVKRFRGVALRLVDVLQDREITALLKDTIITELRDVDAAHAVAAVLGLLTKDDTHELVLDELLKLSQSFFNANQNWVKEKIREACPWFVPSFVDKKIFDAIVQRTGETFGDALSNRSHELRLRVHAAVTDLIKRLEHEDEYRTTFNHFKEVLLANEEFLSYVSTVRDGISRVLTNDLAKEEPRLIRPLHTALDNFCARVLADAEFREKMNHTLRALAGMLIGNHRHDIGETVARTVDSWDSSTLVERMESQVGKDLQYIRINGTLVGGIVGLVLYFVTQLLR